MGHRRRRTRPPIPSLQVDLRSSRSKSSPITVYAAAITAVGQRRKSAPSVLAQHHPDRSAARLTMFLNVLDALLVDHACTLLFHLELIQTCPGWSAIA